MLHARDLIYFTTNLQGKQFRHGGQMNHLKVYNIVNPFKCLSTCLPLLAEAQPPLNILMPSALGEIFSRWHIEIFFFFFSPPTKQVLTFHANCQRRQFAWNVKSCFLGKNIINLSSSVQAQKVIKVKEILPNAVMCTCVWRATVQHRIPVHALQ